tara:strand:- start:86 stop:703 length:618 start_codon:yes stop_codon:yes gene_type:complete
MSKQIQITLFTFDELSEESQQRVIEPFRAAYDPDYSFIYDEFINDMSEKYGADIDVDDIQWSGFWSQGDGASFTCEFDPSVIYPILKEELGEDQIDSLDIHDVTLAGAVSARFGRQNYSHENTVQGSLLLKHDLDGGSFILPEIEAYKTVMETKLTEIIREECKDLYRSLQDHHEKEMEEETIKERIRQFYPDCRYREDGTVFVR